MRILIAEDEDFSRDLLRGHLEKLGHDVVTAANGLEAREILAGEEFPLVITDWVMPGLDGLELVRHIRARKSAAYVYIILLTAKYEKRDVVQGIMEGADDFLTKPYDRDELQVRVRAGERVIELEKRLMARNAELEAAKAKLEQANVRMMIDLEAAARIQQSLLPTSQAASNAVDFAWLFRPCDELAGDIFNFFQIDSEHIAFYLLDVVGHGVPAALLSVTLSRLLSPAPTTSSVLYSSEQSGHRSKSPSELAADLNQQFQMNDDNGQFFTLVFGSLNLRTKELRFVCAGHPNPVYVPFDGAPRILAAKGGFPIGISEGPTYEEDRVVLRAGDRIFLYSDGLLDARSPRGDFFGEDGLVDCVRVRHRTLKETVESLEKKILDWCQEDSPNDDISVLALSIARDD